MCVVVVVVGLSPFSFSPPPPPPPLLRRRSTTYYVHVAVAAVLFFFFSPLHARQKKKKGRRHVGEGRGGEGQRNNATTGRATGTNYWALRTVLWCAVFRLWWICRRMKNDDEMRRDEMREKEEVIFTNYTLLVLLRHTKIKHKTGPRAQKQKPRQKHKRPRRKQQQFPGTCHDFYAVLWWKNFFIIFYFGTIGTIGTLLGTAPK